MVKNILSRLYHLALETSALLLLLIAVIITGIRLTLPNIDDHHEHIEDWASEYFNYPVEVASISADWDSWLPNFYLHQVKISTTDSSENSINFDLAHISIDILSSLYKMEIVPESLTVSGINLMLLQQQSQRDYVAKYFAYDLRHTRIENNSLLRWLLEQRNILLQDTRITLIDTGNDEQFILYDAELNIRNNNYRTQINGTATLPPPYGNTINFSIDARGDLFTPNWSATSYFESEAIDLALLPEDFHPPALEEYQGLGDIQLWSTWNQAKLRSLEGRLKLDNVTLGNQQSTIQLQQMIGNFMVTSRSDGGIHLLLDLEKLATENGTWPKSLLSLTQITDPEQDDRYIINADYLNLDDINDLLQTFPALSQQPQAIKDFQLSGELNNTSIKYDPSLDQTRQLQISSEFSDLGIRDRHQKIAFEGLSGSIDGMQHAGTLHINSNIATLETTAFVQPISFYELKTKLDWQFQDDELRLHSDQIKTHTEDFYLLLRGKMRFSPDKELPFIDMLMGIKDLEIKRLVPYLPTNLPTDFREWLSSSLRGGEINSAQIALRGWLEDYPFHNAEGTFNGFAEIENGTLHYDPQWPQINDIDATLFAKGETLTLDAAYGRIFTTDLTQTRSVISGIASATQLLTIDSKINGQLQDGSLFIKNSPLGQEQTMQQLVEQNISGGMDLLLHIDIPLSTDPISFTGRLSILDGSIADADTDIAITKINGNIEFSEDTVSGSGIRGRFADYPVDLSIESYNDTGTKITLAGIADPQFISSQLLHYFPSIEPWHPEIERRISGTCTWQGSIITNHTGDPAETGTRIIIQSDLQGLALDLPSPLAKGLESEPLKLEIKPVSNKQQEINIQYADILNAILDIRSNVTGQQELLSAALSFGDQAASNNDSTLLSISGNIDHLVIDEWLGLIQRELDTNLATGQALPLALDIHADTLHFANQSFSQVEMKLDRDDPVYQLNINSADISGDIYIPGTTGATIIKLHRLRLSDIVDIAQKKKNMIKPDSIPSLDIDISELIYLDTALGRIKLTLAKKDHGLAIENINLSKEDMLLSGHGSWNIINGIDQSSFDLQLHAGSINTILGIFNYTDNTIESGKADISLKLKWQGTPIDFSLSGLEGDLDIHIEKGQLMNIEPSIGRLLNLINLHTLPKRFIFDFADIFSEGLAFDHITGNFHLQNGHAYTNDAFVSGYATDINFSGRTGLIAQDYDNLVTVIPKISSSLPITGMLLGPIGIGVGTTMLLTKDVFSFLNDGIDNLLLRQYRLTGSWYDPQVEAVTAPAIVDEQQ